VNERGELALRQEFDELHQSREVGSVYPGIIGLEGIGAIGDAVEHGGRAQAFDHLSRRREIGEIDFEDMRAFDSREPPGRTGADRAIDVVAVLQQPAQQIGAHEAARPKHEDRPAQPLHPIADFQHRPAASAAAASRMLWGPRPLHRRR